MWFFLEMRNLERRGKWRVSGNAKRNGIRNSPGSLRHCRSRADLDARKNERSEPRFGDCCHSCGGVLWFRLCWPRRAIMEWCRIEGFIVVLIVHEVEVPFARRRDARSTGITCFPDDRIRKCPALLFVDGALERLHHGERRVWVAAPYHARNPFPLRGSTVRRDPIGGGPSVEKGEQSALLSTIANEGKKAGNQSSQNVDMGRKERPQRLIDGPLSSPFFPPPLVAAIRF
ncbi:hypothetical protein DFH06DRAFT_1187832 [Mycena polygramma]|nr:hypothetical protein DFH06DRAFT_1187832 [Mycena polygramma]